MAASDVLDPPASILVFEAHSDDAVIGMGATIKKFSDQGTTITQVTVTKGETAHTLENVDDIVEIRRAEGTQADAILGVTTHVFLDHGCQAVENDRPTFQEFVKLIRKFRPDWIFTHAPSEWHRDHRAISAIAEEAWWKASEQNVLPELGEPFRAKACLFYEVLPMFTQPDVCLDVSAQWQAKLDALECFASQAQNMSFHGLVEGKGLYRGYLVGAAHAESFVYSTFLPRDRF
jgi:LmbE family N-acetylglucosaminyl deacetylase